MTWLIVALTAAAAGTVQTVTGFGAAVVLMLVLPHLFSVVTASAVSTSICIALTASLAWKFRRKTDFRFIALPIAVFSLSSVVMINLIKSLDLWLIGAAFGAFLLALSLYYLFSIGGADSDKPGRHRVYPAGQGGRHAACQTAQRRSDQAGNLSFCRHFGRNDAD